MITYVVRPKAMILLFIHCLLLHPLFAGYCVRSVFYFVVLCVLSRFSIISLRKRELVGLFLFSSYGHNYCVSVSLPQGAMGWFAMCDCGIACQPHLLFGTM